MPLADIPSPGCVAAGNDADVIYEFNYLMFGSAARTPEEREELLPRGGFSTPANPEVTRIERGRVEEVRRLAIGGWPENGLPTEEAWRHGIVVSSHVLQFVFADQDKDKEGVGARLYVLEFQGPHMQYLKLGRTEDLLTRVKVHREEAFRNGLVLLNGWASPQLNFAADLEAIVLRCAEGFPQLTRRGERFYGMRFETGRDICRAVCDELMWYDFDLARTAEPPP